MEYNSTSLTRDGATIFAQADATKKALILDKVVISERVIAEGTDISALTLKDFTNAKQFDVNNVAQHGGTFSATSVISNTGLTTDFGLALIGILAHLEDSTDQKLVAVLIGNDPFVLPKDEDTPFRFVPTFTIGYSATQDFTMEVNEDVYITQANLQEVIEAQGFVTKQYVDDALKGIDLSTLATKVYVDDAIKNNKVTLPDDLVYTDKDATVTGQYTFSKDAKGADGSTYVTANKLNSTVGPMDNWQKYKLTQDNGQAKPYSGDINNLKTAGDYYSTSTTNAPDGGARWFIRVMVSGSIVEQMAYADTWNMMYDRTFKNNSWTAWQKRMMYSDLTNGLNKKPDNNQVVHRDPNTGKATDKTDFPAGNLTVGDKQVYGLSEVADENSAETVSSSDLGALYWYEEK